VIVRFVNIGRIVNHQSLDILFIANNQIDPKSVKSSLMHV